MSRLYPYHLTAKLVPAIWGGNALVERYGKSADATANLGEAWECFGGNVIANGEFAGKTLDELYRDAGPALLGLVPDAPRGYFPLLTKLIDAREALSVQVHPDDAAARRLEQQLNGKTECWVILEAAPDAEIIFGFASDSSEADVRKRVAAGTLGDVLRRIKVKAGDVYFLPAGTVHAIGKGIVLFEVQQASDLTYRLFDWNRKDAQGNGRELHIDKAVAVLNYAAAKAGGVKGIAYRLDGTDRVALIADAHFGLEELTLANNGRFYTESVVTALTAKETPVRIRGAEGTCTVPAWNTVIIPAGIPRVELEADSATSVFLATCAGADKRTQARLELLAFDQTKMAAFLGQFTTPVAVAQ